MEKTADRTLMISDVQTLKSSPKGDNLTSEEESACDDAQDGGKIIDDSEDWNKNQQTILEWALRQYPKGTEQRWEKIAEHLPGKSKVCMCLLSLWYGSTRGTVELLKICISYTIKEIWKSRPLSPYKVFF